MIQDPDNMRIVENIYRDFGRGDMTSVLNAMADDVEWNVMIHWHGGPSVIPYAGRFYGRTGVAKCFARLLDLVRPEPEIIPREYIVNGGSVMVNGGEMRRVRASRQLTENRWSMVWTMRDGKVAKFFLYEDTIGVV